MVEEGTLHGQVAHGVASGIEVEQPIETNGLFRTYECAYRSVGLQAAAGADTYQLKATQTGLFFARLEIDVCQGIQFVHHDIDVVTSDTGGNHRNTFPLVSTGDSLELAAFHFTFLVLEMGGNQCHPSGVAYQDDFVCQPFGLYVKMKYRTVFIDDQFGRGEIFLHMLEALIFCL
ncbi:hypothetical protein HMPREF2141_02320 [Bacteroides uniformis]|nr:hypothetical protein HMPREF2141_02320 [Bacteroides uniformis]